MKKLTLCLALCLAYATPTLANASLNNTTLKKQGTSLADIVPSNWHVLTSQKGDIDNDGIDDLVFVMQDTDTNKITNSDWGKTDENPRVLAIYTGEKKWFRTVYKQQQVVTDFIPLKDNPSLLEPFNEDSKGLNITDKGVIELTFNYFMSAGGWEMSNETYKFQWRNKAYQLIGYDYHSRHRASSETTEYSINFLNNTMSKSHYFDDPDAQRPPMSDDSEALFNNTLRRFELDTPFTLSTINEFDSSTPDILFENRHYPKAIGKNLADVIPTNWQIASKTTGDLNRDGIEDVVVMIKDTLASKNDIDIQFDSNHTLMAVYFGSSDSDANNGLNGLVKQGIYPNTGFENYKPAIDSKGVLSFQRNSNNNNSGNNSNNVNSDHETYKFQLRDVYNNKQFVLIGYDKSEKTCLKNKSSVDKISVNFLSKKAIHTQDGKKTPYRFTLTQPYTLHSDVVYGFGIDALEKIRKWQY